ncbi:MAG: peptide/nickel transport system ATP-binding protein ddpF [Solirubrobacteraceae bacterium]|nr:peptide/nickel transport system ATP-binding protein ddpF [Solirubrobacteraceae bacterium]
MTLHRDGRAIHALRGVSLEIRPHEIVALVGESGSGKSTLGLSIQGLLPRDSDPIVRGSILVDGQEMVGSGDDAALRVRRFDVRSIFQDPMTSLNPTMRVGKQVVEVSRDGQSAEQWLEHVGVVDPHARVRAFPHQLSGGQRQRAMIAMAMTARPRLIIADEPTTALDVTVQAQILEIFRRLRDEHGSAFLFVTHDLAVASAIADRIVVLYAGRVVETGEVARVHERPAHPYTAALLGARFGLDADKDKQLPTLKGDAPLGALADPPGCPFAPRCLLQIPECIADVPPLAPVRQHGGSAACLRSELVTPGLWKQTAGGWPARAESAAQQLLEVDDVNKRFVARGLFSGRHVVQALRGVSMRIDEGEAVALVGESGSGKTTLLRIIAGLVKPDAGSVRRHKPDRPQMVYQDAAASLTPWLSVEELVGERLRAERISREERRKRTAAALEAVNLPASMASARPGELSGGQRQRVAIARAIVVPPRLLLCDEPVSAMDVSLAAAILNLLVTLRLQLGMAMLFVTHDLAAARFVADRIIVLQNGEIVEAGSSDTVVRAPSHPYTTELMASMPSSRAVMEP